MALLEGQGVDAAVAELKEKFLPVYLVSIMNNLRVVHLVSITKTVMRIIEVNDHIFKVPLTFHL